MYGPYPGRPHFSVLGIPVHISMWHGVLMGVLFYQLLRQDGALGIGVIIIASFSVLMHELGHAFVSRYFRLAPRVALVGFGGLCYHEPARRPRDQFLITAAGPAMNFLLALLFELLQPTAAGTLASILYYAVVINIVWGAYNLLPIYPLDGGVLTQVVLNKLIPRGDQADRITHWTGVVLGGALGAWGLLSGQFFVGIIMGFAAFENWQQLQVMERSPVRHETRKHTSVRELLKQARTAYSQGNLDAAARLCHQARAEPFVSIEEARHIWHMLALTAARQQKYEDAIRYAERLPSSAEMAQIQAVCVLALAEPGRARTFLSTSSAALVDAPQLESLRVLARRTSESPS